MSNNAVDVRSRSTKNPPTSGPYLRGADTIIARVVTATCGVCALAVGVTTLLGYALDIRRLTDWDGDGISMFPNAAVCGALSGASLLLLAARDRDSRRAALRVISCFVGAVGGLTLFQHLSGVNLGIDTLLIERPWGHRAAIAPMRMGPPASTSYLSIGVALLVATYGPSGRRITSALGVVVVAIASLSLVGFVFGADQLFGVARFTGIARQTSLALAAIGIGLIASAPDRGLAELLRRDDPGGAIARRLLLPIIAIPLLLGWLRVQGEEAEYFGAAFGTSLMALVMILLFLALLWRTAERLSRVARVSRAAEERLRESEGSLRTLTDSLETKVAQRTAELELQAARLRKLAIEVNRVEQSERKRLAALLHDDLQQSLVAAKLRLVGVRDLLAEGKAAAETNTTMEFIDEAIETSRSLTRELRPPALYEGGLVPALKELASMTLRLYRIRVSISASKAIPRFAEETDVLIFGCVRELLLNAAKHSGTDEVSIIVDLREGALHLIVSDRGRGFDGDSALFQNSRGFGLFSIQERVSAIGGTTKIDSRRGEGCRVELMVPITGQAAAAGPVAASVIESKTHAGVGKRGERESESTCRVVVADDHPIVREGIANLISQVEKIRVIAQVSDGFEAIEAVERLRPDVVVLDVNMPRLNGIEAAREIHRRWPDVAVVGLSIQNDEATAGSMLNAGASAFVSKSDHPDKITNAILGTLPRERVHSA